MDGIGYSYTPSLTTLIGDNNFEGCDLVWVQDDESQNTNDQ